MVLSKTEALLLLLLLLLGVPLSTPHTTPGRPPVIRVPATQELRRATDGDCPGGAVPHIDAQEPVH